MRFQFSVTKRERNRRMAIRARSKYCTKQVYFLPEQTWESYQSKTPFDEIAPAFSVRSLVIRLLRKSRGTRHEHLLLYRATAAQKSQLVFLV